MRQDESVYVPLIPARLGNARQGRGLISLYMRDKQSPHLENIQF